MPRLRDLEWSHSTARPTLCPQTHPPHGAAPPRAVILLHVILTPRRPGARVDDTSVRICMSCFLVKGYGVEWVERKSVAVWVGAASHEDGPRVAVTQRILRGLHNIEHFDCPSEANLWAHFPWQQS